MKFTVYPHVTSPVDFINKPSEYAIQFFTQDNTAYFEGYVCLDPVEIEINVDSEELRLKALSQIEAAEEKTKAELLEKLNKLKEEKEKLLSITHQI